MRFFIFGQKLAHREMREFRDVVVMEKPIINNCCENQAFLTVNHCAIFLKHSGRKSI